MTKQREPTFADLRRNLKLDDATMPRARLVLLGDTPTQLLRDALRGYGLQVGLSLEIIDPGFDQIDRELLDPTSETHRANPQYLVVFESTDGLLARFMRTTPAERSRFAEQQLERVRELLSASDTLSECTIVWCNYPEPGEDVFGSFACKVPASFTFQVRLFGVELMRLATERKNLFLCDLASLQNARGRSSMRSATTYVNTGIVLDVDAFALLARQVLDVILALRGVIKKCLVLDLDNTLWGGVIGDDGMAGIQVGELGIGRAFTQIQRWAKLLRERGILLAVCSKNDEAVARKPFDAHPDMVLRMSDIAVFVANWENKVDNLRHIQEVLGIGLDSMVFVDDNPFEREMVRAALPGVTVPDLPEDPAEYASYLAALNLFETASHSDEDGRRTQMLQEASARTAYKRSFADEDDYLRSIEMRSRVTAFDAFDVPRIAQLTQRSNQFNLRTVRYSEADVEALRLDASVIGLSFTLGDKLGNHGLVSVIILRRVADETAFVDTWLMSCRVLKRGMERFVLTSIVDAARSAGISRIEGEYLPTEKNGMVRNHYAELGFAPAGERWELIVDRYVPVPTHIAKEPAP